MHILRKSRERETREIEMIVNLPSSCDSPSLSAVENNWAAPLDQKDDPGCTSPCTGPSNSYRSWGSLEPQFGPLGYSLGPLALHLSVDRRGCSAFRARPQLSRRQLLPSIASS